MAAQKMQVFRGSCSTDMSQGCSKSRNKTTFFCGFGSSCSYLQFHFSLELQQ